MKFERIIYGVLLLFIGAVLLLDNFNVIEFYWRNVWSFWPIFLIIAGVKLLLNRNESQLGSKVSLGILIITLIFLFFKGQENPRNHSWWSDRNDISIDIDDSNDGDERVGKNGLHFSEPYLAADSAKKTILNLSAGGTSFNLIGVTDSLFEARVNKKSGNFSLITNSSDSTNTVTFKMNNKRNGDKNSWSFNTGGNDVDISLNTLPLWEMNIKMGAGEVDFDLSDYKVRELNFDGGAADVSMKIGDRLPITDVNVKTGVANVEIKVPANSGCRIKTHTGLSSRDFKGFIKKNDGSYETPNYKESTNKIFINLDGGLSNFEVDTY